MTHRVLIISKESEGPGRIKSYLQAIGYELLGARNAESGLEAAVQQAPDLVIVDGAVSNGGGIELVAELRRRAPTKVVPIILALAKDDEEIRERARQANPDEIIVKPFDPNLFTTSARLLLRIKSAHDEIERARREISLVFQEQRSFMETLVHDLKNPIAVVHVNLAWLLDRLGVDPPEISEALGDAQEGIARLQKMVDDLLMVGMLDQARLPLKREYIQVTELLDQVLKSHEKEATARKVSLSLSLHDNLGVVGDPAVLRRAVQNMVENSLRHTPASGRVELSARTGAGVEIAVSNTGRPLAAEEKAQLLEKKPASGTYRIPSGGLGLYFCRRAVEAHDGEIDVVESDEWSTSLVMRLPQTG